MGFYIDKNLEDWYIGFKMQKNKKYCYCGNKIPYTECCQQYSELFEINKCSRKQLILYDWLKHISPAHQSSFISLTSKYLYRVCLYYENIRYRYQDVIFTYENDDLNETIHNIRLSINNSILGSLTLSAQGLFLQSGILHRTAFEDLFVVLDFIENQREFIKFYNSKYSTNNLISRVNKYIPREIIEWYRYFTSNFSHFSEIHTAPLIPKRCHPDNYIIVTVFQNLVRIMVAYDLIFERIAYSQISNKHFWNKNNHNNLSIDMENSLIIKWASQLGSQINLDFQIHREGGSYAEKSFTFKR